MCAPPTSPCDVPLEHSTRPLTEYLKSCVGNYRAAEAHIEGILTLLEMKGLHPRALANGPAIGTYDESLERLILV
jgi:hypothetical protein